MKILISGGCKNGKSTFAQYLAAYQKKQSLFYIATMQPYDGEDRARVLRHQNERAGWGFSTIEQPQNIHDILDKADHDGSFLLDSTTALLSNEMFLADGSINHHAGKKIIRNLQDTLAKLEDIVIVSDAIYSDAQSYDPLTEEYRTSLAAIDLALASICDTVLEISFTNCIIHKGSLPQGFCIPKKQEEQNMVLIFGGAYQGKLAYAQRLYGDSVCSCTDRNLDLSKKILDGYEEVVRDVLASGEDPDAFTRALLPQLVDHVVICRDVSCGVVPMEKEVRAWREATGRSMAILASASNSVVRVYCGIGTKVK